MPLVWRRSLRAGKTSWLNLSKSPVAYESA